ncbi:hypothetical protein EGI11_03115 [Chryseobacterium sp. H3056]|uniref:Uncharacterized protein n=1 Tax=Kaistella daneshvariae TaxID=2487074 RepID=A0A3N0WYL8_9FLAO|nr:hypothetical protein EGI11_03115 [Kaistella daneshvariae]
MPSGRQKRIFIPIGARRKRVIPFKNQNKKFRAKSRDFFILEKRMFKSKQKNSALKARNFSFYKQRKLNS